MPHTNPFGLPGIDTLDPLVVSDRLGQRLAGEVYGRRATSGVLAESAGTSLSDFVFGPRAVSGALSNPASDMIASQVFGRRGFLQLGVRSIRKSGSTPLFNDVTLSAGTNVTITQTGQDISIASSSGITQTGTEFFVAQDGDTKNHSGTAASASALSAVNTILVGNGVKMPEAGNNSVIWQWQAARDMNSTPNLRVRIWMIKP